MSHGRRTVVWVNRHAGNGKASRLAAEAVSTLRARGVETVVVDQPDAATASSAVAAELASGAERLVAIGGDGTVHHALQLVAGTGVALGIVPTGSGDDIARTVGLRRGDHTSALSALVDGDIRSVDLGRSTDANGSTRWFGAALYAGFDARVNARANRLPRWLDRAKYPLAVGVEIGALRSLPFVLTTDEHQQRTDLVALVVGNGPSYGGGMLICPDADINDGALDLTLVADVDRRTLLRVLPGVYSGRHVQHPAVSTMKVAQCLIAAPGAVAYADGERVGPLPIRVEAVPGALNVLVPPH